MKKVYNSTNLVARSSSSDHSTRFSLITWWRRRESIHHASLKTHKLLILHARSKRLMLQIGRIIARVLHAERMLDWESWFPVVRRRSISMDHEDHKHPWRWMCKHRTLWGRVRVVAT